MEADRFDEIQQARRGFDEVVAEIRQVPGHEDFLSEPALADILNAADDHPLCYLTAADSDGAALIVRDGDVIPVVLPMLSATSTRERVESHLRHYRAFRRDPLSLPSWTSDVDDTTQWLWEAVMAPVLSLCPATEMTIITGGLLGLLPLHAAWFPDSAAVTGRRYALDDVVISYVPNARSLTVARGRAQQSTMDTVLAVADPLPRRKELDPLHSAIHEVNAACDGYTSVLLSGSAATASNVRSHLSTADILHFACHGIADLDVPANSHLVLAGDDRLTLRDLLGMDLRARLAVLSACETSMAGTDLPDEALGLPTGLLHAGVAGVVASLWAVNDLSSAILMTEFYRRWYRSDSSPARALRDAQQWLRDSTNAEKVHAAEQLPAEVRDHFLDMLLFREPDDRDEAAIPVWAAFEHIGV
ncbi:CHAT domain-containing protein [Kibdelosporangium banguiense]|uniref:CHAT domain-containing protein n=1 Tax=Kibdelosporangium banguiense TaxID=1365924 RepID=A0ABS4TVM9_9PSEU|nr:CHAT domain-containing protein [Kibdelosporangium banguiense]MBP2328010.1 CHAT domain-containing protein [Kibdelosporangium banguiense]